MNGSKIEKIKEDILKISKLKTYIEIKFLSDKVETHDGNGARYVFFFQTPELNEYGYFIILEDDFWSGELVRKSPFLPISKNEIKKINDKNFEDIIKNKIDLYNKMVREDRNTFSLKEKSIDFLNKEIQKLDLDINPFGETSYSDVLLTLSILGNNVNNR